MAMRRPRIKAQANIQLNAKRKSKITTETKPKSSESNVGNVGAASAPAEKGEQEIDSITEKPIHQDDIPTNDAIEVTGKEVRSDASSSAIDTTASENILSIVDNDDKMEAGVRGGASSDESKNSSTTGNHTNRDGLNCTDAFKCPPKVEYQRSISHASNNGADDVFYSDIEENAQQMDLQKSPNGFPMSPSKNQTRQRIKATPIFGQRRNSFVGSSPSPHTSGPDDSPNISSNDFVVPTQRRERHLSASLSTNSNSSSSSYHHHTPHKYLPNGVVNAGMGRVRTESGCSVFSDTNVSSHKSRKTDELKQNLKREFEARFLNGIPDKSALKMSDLIYYNPATNPMEQKPNPNIKVENGEASSSCSSSDIKPFKGKKEKDVDKNDIDDMPVPQLKLNSNGELILDDKSLVIETTAEQEARKVLANSSLIYLDENTGMNGFYSRQKRTRDWPSSETIKFYRCLQTVGTDFSLMVPLFPNRTRRDLKLKFKKEERINGSLINKALLYPKQFNIEELKQQIEEEDRLREEEANKFKQYKEAAAKELKKRKFVRSSADCSLNGGNVYQNENEQKAKKPRKSNKKASQTETIKTTPVQINDTELNSNNTVILNVEEDSTNVVNTNIKTETEKAKRRRRRVPNIKKESPLIAQQSEQTTAALQSDEPSIALQTEQLPQSIKVEIIKNEPLHMSSFYTKTEVHNDDDDQLEEEFDELPHSHIIDMDHTDSMPLPTSDIVQTQSPSVPMTESPVSSDSSSTYINEDIYCDEGRTFVNLDDGSVTTITDLNQRPPSPPVYQQQPIINHPTPSPSPPSLLPPLLSQQQQQHYYPQSPQMTSSTLPISQPDLINNDTCSSMMSERELNEQDIELILTELAEGSLVLVSTLDPEDPDKVLNEIFMVDKNTGDLCDEPLNIPDNIVQCILSVMS